MWRREYTCIVSFTQVHLQAHLKLYLASTTNCLKVHSYFSALSSLFHLKNQYSKDVNFKFQMKPGTWTVKPFYVWSNLYCLYFTLQAELCLPYPGTFSLIFQTDHSSAVKFSIGYEKNISFLMIAKSRKKNGKKKLKRQDWAPLRVRAFFHKTVRVCHVYCNFKIGFTCRITVIFGTLKDGSLLINTLASNICFSYRNIFQNGVDALPKIVDAFLSKSSNFHPVRIIR